MFLNNNLFKFQSPILTMLIDAHCHLDKFDNIQIPEDILPIPTGYSHESNQKTVEIAKKYKLPFVLGIAPQTAIFEGLNNLDEAIDFIRNNKPNAIGEIGLDFHWIKKEQDAEIETILFNKMLDLAEEMNLPIVIHSRKAEKECFEIIKFRGIKKFLMHYYSGDKQLAKEIADYGGFFTIPPVRSKSRKEVIIEVGLDHLMVESDAPYVGKTIDEIKKAIEYIADILGKDQSVVIEKTTNNAKVFFGV